MFRLNTLPVLVFLLVSLVNPTYGDGPKSRMLEFDYEVSVKDIPADAKDLKIWIPHLSETPYQIIEDVKIAPKESSAITYDKTYRNKIINYSLNSFEGASFKIKVAYKVRRYEFSNKPGENASGTIGDGDDLAKYLQANRLVTLSPTVKGLAGDITDGKETTREKARAIYDYVFDNVSYNKNIPGWGRGDTQRVCLIKAGNCTDFHSLFISLSRASGIPAKFVIGVPIPEDTAGELKGYHCWAEFYDEKLGWVPVDISEAWKDKAKKEYYFGAVGKNRLEFTHGRDIILEPMQEGESLNYFVYPYVEVDGKEFKKLSVLFKYRDNLIKSIALIN